MSGVDVPDGYRRVRLAQADLVALSSILPAIREALDGGTLYGYAAGHPGARLLTGRRTVFAVPLPDETTRVVVRHSHHGGLMAPLTRDRFLGRTRAPRELAAALRLRRAGIPTPEVIAFATYPAGAIFRRCDIVTREVPASRDLGAVFVESPRPEIKRRILVATACLLRSLTAAGAHHPDLNVKNVLLAEPDHNGLQAYVLDVDRVTFGRAGDPRLTIANLRRLFRSARKWRCRLGRGLDETDLAWLAAAAAREEG